jgi:hypothetical protein
LIGIHFAGEDLNQSRNRLAIACGVVRKKPDGSADPGPYADLAAFARDRWQACPIEDADLVMYALPYHEGAATRKVAEAAREAGLPCIFFRATDDPTPANPPWGVVYRTSIYRKRLTARARAMPGFTDDLLEECASTLVPRSKRERPSVSFCGHVGSAKDRFVENVVGLLRGNRDKAIGMALRRRALEYLAKSPHVEASFIPRTQIWGGAATGSAEFDAERRAAVRREYLDNVLGSDYGLSLRGKGNYSFRLYEIFALGRIPLFIDTDCVLPFESEIDWRRHCAWVDVSNIERAGEILAQFHADLHADDFVQLQLDNRQIWLDYLSPTAIYTRILEQALESGTA